MPRFRIALALTAVALLVFAAGGTAHAQYDTPTTTPGSDTGAIPEITVVRGETVEARGVRCRPYTLVVVTFDDGRELARLRADADGAYVVTLTIPGDASVGRHLVTSRCKAGVATERAAAKIALGSTGDGAPDADGYLRQYLWVNVLAKGQAPRAGGALARTGSSNTAPLVGIGSGALVLGGAFVYGSRRPRSAA